uniref:Tripartite motif-containing protein 16-like n=1 Tax=Sinocyclocheilus rhinocerous TaxID=307959 RepID=A0A673MT32_9TELE
PIKSTYLNCSICLDLLKDPVTIPCGHSYCMSCITGCWDQDDQKGVYSCPQCRQTFTPRPVLGKNTILAEVLEKLKKTKLQAARPAQCYVASGDVECDVCTGRKYKAIKSCLVCLNSYCQNHLEQHENLFKGKRHNLMDATGQLQEMICPQHEKLLEIFCRTDQQCICYLCTMDEHKNHETVSAAAERTEKQVLIFEQKNMEDSERIFTELIRSIERSRSEVTQLIRDQEKTAVSRAEGQLEQLEQEIEDLRRRDAELEQLSHTDNHIHFLQSLSVPPGSTDSSKITVSSRLSFDDIGKSVSHLREKLEHFCREEMAKISDMGNAMDHSFTLRYRLSIMPEHFISIPEPKKREEFLQYYRRFTLDENTMHKYLCLSEENRMITETNTDQSYPDHPDRFDSLTQVLCRESVCGRCYWEVEWSGRGVCISVSYKSISRKGRGDECAFGYNDQSWSLYCFPSSYCKYSFCHNYKETELTEVSSSSRIGVYVDHGAGTLSFYSVSDTMTLIHRVHTTFTQPLYAGFRVYGSVKLCDITK